jgi:cytochrome b pre-mRNA-processing protein 3
MVFGLFQKRSDRPAGELYRQLVAAARQPVFYDRFGVADTADGRLELLMLHTGLVVSRLSAPDANRDCARDLSEAFFADMDGTLRELGISDVAVPKKMKKMASAFYGRLRAYGEAADEAALSEALTRNIFSGVEHPATPALARYVRTAAAVLRDTDAADLVRGRVTLPDPHSFLDEEVSR